MRCLFQLSHGTRPCSGRGCDRSVSGKRLLLPRRRCALCINHIGVRTRRLDNRRCRHFLYSQPCIQDQNNRHTDISGRLLAKFRFPSGRCKPCRRRNRIGNKCRNTFCADGNIPIVGGHDWWCEHKFSRTQRLFVAELRNRPGRYDLFGECRMAFSRARHRIRRNIRCTECGES